uniref:Uncharacterized protein n=1 Tax=Oncorhynchus kisutch TaxID=8019 RepID=A0A8C7FFJ8_ONCKI
MNLWLCQLVTTLQSCLQGKIHDNKCQPELKSLSTRMMTLWHSLSQLGNSIQEVTGTNIIETLYLHHESQKPLLRPFTSNTIYSICVADQRLNHKLRLMRNGEMVVQRQPDVQYVELLSGRQLCGGGNP